MKIVVQKYGGTSVNTKERRLNIIKNAKDAIKEGLSPVIVVSAMGRKPEAYATDSLFSLLPDLDGISMRSKDLLGTCGEIITTVIVSEELRLSGLKSTPLTGGQAGIMTDGTFGEGEIVNIDTARIKSLISDDVVPIVAGFQGISKDNEITTLGRGGSDITATALGAALDAELVEIYTDVDGVYTTDPRITEKAYMLEDISFADVLNMAEFGAKVIHPRAVKFAMDKEVPTAVLNVNKDRTTSHTSISAKKTDNFNAVACLENVNEEKTQSKITVLGNRICLEANISQKITDLLKAEGIEAFGIKEDADYISVCVLNERAKDSVRVLHDALIG